MSIKTFFFWIDKQLKTKYIFSPGLLMLLNQVPRCSSTSQRPHMSHSRPGFLSTPCLTCPLMDSHQGPLGCITHLPLCVTHVLPFVIPGMSWKCKHVQSFGKIELGRQSLITLRNATYGAPYSSSSSFSFVFVFLSSGS